MGCGSSTENNDKLERQGSNEAESSKEHLARDKIVVNVTTHNDNKPINRKHINNLESSNKHSEGNLIISPQESSLEVLIPKRDKPRTSVGVIKRNSTKSQRKSKQLKQVVAWGKKTSTTETNFLEDLRTQRRQSNPFYEQEYEIDEVDETARLIESGGLNKEESSLSGISDSSQQMLKNYKEGSNQEESFDVSKIIDVEKFRAANAGEKKNTENNNEMGINLNKNLSGEVQRLNRTPVQDARVEGLNELYNEDDKDLIESIEKEFLVTQDNFLPGQIVN